MSLAEVASWCGEVVVRVASHPLIHASIGGALGYWLRGHDERRRNRERSAAVAGLIRRELRANLRRLRGFLHEEGKVWDLAGQPPSLHVITAHLGELTLLNERSSAAIYEAYVATTAVRAVCSEYQVQATSEPIRMTESESVHFHRQRYLMRQQVESAARRALRATRDALDALAGAPVADPADDRPLDLAVAEAGSDAREAARAEKGRKGG